MLVDLMGMGKRPDEITVDSAMFRAVSSQYEQALAATADVLGLRIDEIQREIRTATVPYDVEVSCGTLPAGSVVGQILSWTAYRDGAPVLVARGVLDSCQPTYPTGMSSLDGEFLVRVVVDGVSAAAAGAHDRQRPARPSRGRRAVSSRSR